jgi:hypothetical protein
MVISRYDLTRQVGQSHADLLRDGMSREDLPRVALLLNLARQVAWSYQGGETLGWHDASIASSVSVSKMDMHDGQDRLMEIRIEPRKRRNEDEAQETVKMDHPEYANDLEDDTDKAPPHHEGTHLQPVHGHTRSNRREDSMVPDPRVHYCHLRMDAIGIFVFDMQSADMYNDDLKEEEEDDGGGMDNHRPSRSRQRALISCNQRMRAPLGQDERPVISEAQWLAFESLCRKKSLRALVLIMEMPLILTSALPPFQNIKDRDIRERLWRHWAACPSQLEQLLLLLFKWKEKMDGREILILSGGLCLGLDTLVKDRRSNFTIHNYTSGIVSLDLTCVSIIFVISMRSLSLSICL